MDPRSAFVHFAEEEQRGRPRGTSRNLPIDPSPGDGQRVERFAITVADWDGEPLTAEVQIEWPFRPSSVRIVGPGKLRAVLVQWPGSEEWAQLHHMHNDFGPRTHEAGSKYRFLVERAKGWGNRRKARVIVEVSGYRPLSKADA